ALLGGRFLYGLFGRSFLGGFLRRRLFRGFLRRGLFGRFLRGPLRLLWCGLFCRGPQPLFRDWRFDDGTRFRYRGRLLFIFLAHEIIIVRRERNRHLFFFLFIEVVFQVLREGFGFGFKVAVAAHVISAIILHCHNPPASFLEDALPR